MPTILDASEKNAVVIQLNGDCAFDEAMKMERLIDVQSRKGIQRFVVDFSLCDYIDSMGVGLLIGAALEINRSGGLMALCSMNQKLKRLLSKASIDKVCRFANTVDEALSASSA